MSTATPVEIDLLVLGGGPAGMAAAWEASLRGERVWIIGRILRGKAVNDLPTKSPVRLGGFQPIR